MPTLLDSKQVVTRKEHRCHGCNKIYPIGTSMYYQAVVDDGKVWSIYMCQGCLDYCDHKKCNECIELEQAYEGYVAECRRESEG